MHEFLAIQDAPSIGGHGSKVLLFTMQPLVRLSHHCSSPTTNWLPELKVLPFTMLQHTSIDNFVRHYSVDIHVDAQAIVRGMPAQKQLMRFACSISRSIDPRRPYRLEDSSCINDIPRVCTLEDRRQARKRIRDAKKRTGILGNTSDFPQFQLPLSKPESLDLFYTVPHQKEESTRSITHSLSLDGPLSKMGREYSDGYYAEQAMAEYTVSANLAHFERLSRVIPSTSSQGSSLLPEKRWQGYDRCVQRKLK